MHVCLKALRIFKKRKMVDQSNNFKELKYLDVGGSKTISEILAEVSQIDDFSKKTSKLDFYVGAFEQELIKIDGFRRELPICMQLLKDAIERLKEEKLQWRGREMEEFIVLKSSNLDRDGRAKVSNDFNEKKSWMSCVQLWSTPVHYENNFNNQERKEEGDSSNGCGESDQYEGCNLKKRRSSSAGAFVPFEKGSTAVPSLTLSTPVAVVDYFNGRGKVVQQPQEHQKKQRRCWSPELHKRFIDALHQLGGPKTATPKQIRELMKVDGLTNDEVKSHLQKFRIHIRKLPSSSSAS